jgi:hypothetical protein
MLRYLDATRLAETRAIITDLDARYHTTYRDYLTDPRFTTEDFADPLHLNREGAIKFSRILNEEIILPRGVCQGEGPPH